MTTPIIENRFLEDLDVGLGVKEDGRLSMADVLADLEESNSPVIDSEEKDKKEPRAYHQTLLPFMRKPSQSSNNSSKKKIKISEAHDALIAARKSVGRIPKDKDIKKRRSASADLDETSR